ncbi:hypothetical protein AGMMS49579_14730 [Spirochaetia bacterium]|nr:hypothetical protein AGMMS49579_14730 [Spirochaetia bacterium]
MRKKGFVLGMLAITLTFGFVLAGCATTEVHPEGSLVLQIGDVLPPPNPGDSQIEDGSYVCSRAEILVLPTLVDMIFGGERIIYNNTKYKKQPRGTKPVAIRINNGKVTEMLAVQDGQGFTSAQLLEKTTRSVETPVWISSAADLDKTVDFNEAKSMIHY